MLIPIQSVLHELILVHQHFLHAALAHVTAVFLFAVNRVREIFIVGRDGFGDGARCATCSEKMTDDLLAGADFGKRSVQVLIQVDAKRFLLG